MHFKITVTFCFVAQVQILADGIIMNTVDRMSTFEIIELDVDSLLRTAPIQYFL